MSTKALRTTPVTRGGTSKKLLLTALHLYAEEGLAAVSLRRISAEAGSRNSAAMHYHFSNKLGVIQALVEMIAEELDIIAHRIRQQEGPDKDLRGAFRNILRPLAELPQTQPWGADAVRFMSRVISENSPDLAEVINPIYQPFWQRVDGQLADLLPDIPEDVRRLRLMFMSVNVFHGMAEVAALSHTPLGDLSHIDNSSLLDHLVDYLIGGLKSPTQSQGVTEQ
ncbi:MAG: AcrR family transcriptional regulator [Halieaceae bacterium]|jgi:AcrR family transcriptional regulator